MARELVFVNPESMKWQPIEKLGTGAWLKVLSYDEETKAGAYLIKFDDGFREPLHSHPGAHDIFFFQGCLVDDEGNESCAGSYFYSPAGPKHEHGPFTAKGDVIFFAYFDGPVFYPEE
ncbi:MAG: cupin domain-containing protein [Thermodesulfobacteriota bacterium]|nr:cupin domain-containing protein [Thermodesulfobacteriota bacterium]